MDPKPPESAISLFFNLRKGSRVKAHWFQANDPPSSLAGMQMKLGVTEKQVEGVVTHIRSDGAFKPHRVAVWVQPDGGGPEVIINPAWIREVQAPASESDSA